MSLDSIRSRADGELSVLAAADKSAVPLTHSGIAER
jgi:hypothetical protein